MITNTRTAWADHRSKQGSPWFVAVVLGLIAAGCGGAEPESPSVAQSPSGDAEEPVPEAPAVGQRRARTVYAPAYSHLPWGPGMAHDWPLSILLSVRNMDSSSTVTLTRVDYFDTSGHRVRRYLERPRDLRPLETAEFTVAAQDETGGSGANFLVYWDGPSDAHALLVESVMSGDTGVGFGAFVSRGIELDRRPDPALFLAPADAAAP